MSNAGLSTQIEEREGIRVIHVTGPLDSETHDSLKELLDPLVKQSRVRIVLDCQNLSYVNSKGLMLLARYHRTAVQNLSFFGIAALNSRILKAIDLLGMGKLVRLYPTVEEALQAAALL